MLLDLPSNVLREVCGHLARRDAYNLSNTCGQLKTSVNYIFRTGYYWGTEFGFRWSVVSDYPALEGLQLESQQCFAYLKRHPDHSWASLATWVQLLLQFHDPGTEKRLLQLRIEPGRTDTGGGCCQVVCQDHWGVDTKGVPRGKRVIRAQLVQTELSALVPFQNFESEETCLTARALRLTFEDNADLYIALRYSKVFSPRTTPPVLNNISVTLTNLPSSHQMLPSGATFVGDFCRLMAFPLRYFCRQPLPKVPRLMSYRNGVVDSFGIFLTPESLMDHPISKMGLPVHSEMAPLRAGSVYDMHASGCIKALPGYFGDTGSRAHRPLVLVLGAQNVGLIQGTVEEKHFGNFARLMRADEDNKHSFPFNWIAREIYQLDNLSQCASAAWPPSTNSLAQSTDFTCLVCLQGEPGRVTKLAQWLSRSIHGDLAWSQTFEEFYMWFRDLRLDHGEKYAALKFTRHTLPELISTLKEVHNKAELKSVSITNFGIRVRCPSPSFLKKLNLNESSVMILRLEDVELGVPDLIIKSTNGFAHQMVDNLFRF